jgi:hypothetical protein
MPGNVAAGDPFDNPLASSFAKKSSRNSGAPRHEAAKILIPFDDLRRYIAKASNARHASGVYSRAAISFSSPLLKGRGNCALVA